MRDDVLEEVLSPGCYIDISRPDRQCTGSDLPEQRRMPKRQVGQHRDFALQHQRKDRLGRVAVGYRIVHLDEVERVLAHHVQDLPVLADVGSGYADVANLPGFLPLLHQGNQRRYAIEIVNLKQVDAWCLQALERSLEAAGAGYTRAIARHELGCNEQLVARAEALKRLTDDRFAVAIGCGRVDHRTTELAHALDLRADLVAQLSAKGVGAQPNRRKLLSGRGDGFGDQRQ